MISVRVLTFKMDYGQMDEDFWAFYAKSMKFIHSFDDSKPTKFLFEL